MFKTSHFVKAFWFALAAMIASAAYELIASAFPRLSRSHADEIALCTGAAFILALVILRRRDTDLLKLEKANFDALVEHLPGLACIVDANRKLVRWNSRFQNALGYSAAELREMPAVQGLAEDYRELVPAVMGQAWETGYAEMEAAWLTKSGVRIPCYMTGVRILVGKQPCVLSVGIDITSQKRAEEALRRSDQQYRRLLTNLPDVAWTSNLTGQITYVSPNAQEVFGQTAQQICQGGTEALIRRIHPDDREAVHLSYRKLFEEDAVFNVEYRLQRGDGEWRWVHDRAIRTHQQNGILFADGVLSDITERKQAEEDLRKGQEQYRRLLTNLPDVTWTMDAERQFTYISPNVENVFGFTPAEAFAAGREVRLSHIYPDDLNAVEDNYRALFLEGRIFDLEYRMLHKDGHWIWVRNRALRTFQQDGKLFADGILSDVTEHKQAQEDLRKSQEQYRRLIANLPDITCTISSEGKTLYMSANVEGLLGYTLQEVLDGDLELRLSRIHPEDAELARKSFHALFFENKVFDLEYRMRHKDGRWIWVRNRSLRTFQQDGMLLADCVLTDITELKQAERVNSRLAAIVMSSPDAIISKTAEGTIVSWNPAAEKMYGYAADEVIGKHVSMLVAPERLGEVSEVLGKIARDEQIERFDSVRMRKDGTRFEVSLAIAAIKDKNGGLLGISTMAHDISLRRQAEENLRKSEEQYRRLLGNLPDVTWTANLQGDVSYLSPNVEQVIGYTAQEFFEQGSQLWFAVIHPDDRARVQEKRRALFETGDTFDIECRAQHKDGHWIWLCERALRTHQQNGVLFADGIISDITERKAAERTDSQLASIVNSSTSAIFGESSNGTIVSWNPAAEKMCGYTAAEAIGKHVATLVAPERLYEVPAVLSKIACGEAAEFDSVCLRKDGSRVDVSLTISPILDKNRNVLGISTIANDISLRKRTEQELVRAKETAETAARAKTQFLANISHELRTPMNGILGMAELALDTQLDAEQRECLLVIQSSGSALLRLINDLLDFTRTESGTLTLDSIAFNLHEAVRQTLRPLRFQAQQVGLEFVSQMDPELPDIVFGDPQRLRQVLVNLVGNAIKFTQQGKVVVRVACNSLNPGCAEVLFNISDTGIGISPEKHAAIFEGFTQSDGSSTRKYGGTGLGLAISSRLVELMHGKIWVESQLGHGSTFCFTVQLPVSETASKIFHPEPAEV